MDENSFIAGTAREFEAMRKVSRPSRSSVDIKCPFCGTVTTAYIWSLYGSGKRCHGPRCSALFNPFTGAVWSPRKKSKRRSVYDD